MFTLTTPHGALTVRQHGERRAPVVIVVNEDREPYFTKPEGVERGHGSPLHAAYAARVTAARLHLAAALAYCTGRATVDGREIPQASGAAEGPGRFTLTGLLSADLRAHGLDWAASQGWDALLVVADGTPVPAKGWEDPRTALRGIRQDTRPRSNRGAPVLDVLAAFAAAVEQAQAPAPSEPTPETAPETAPEPTETAPTVADSLTGADRARARRERRTGVVAD